MKDFFKDFLEPLSYLMYAVLVFLIKSRQKSTERTVLFFYYLFATLILFVACCLSENNLLYNIFFFISSCTFPYYFHAILIKRNNKNTVVILFVINVLLFIYYDVLLKQLMYENNYVRAFCFFSVVIYSLLYFFETITNVNEINILHQFDFWLVSGYLIYFLGCFCIIVYYKYPTPEERAVFWTVQNSILFTSSIITLTGVVWLINHKKFL